MPVTDFKKLSKRGNATKLIDREAFKRIHEESVNILEKVGIRIYSADALNLLKANGAEVDSA